MSQRSKRMRHWMRLWHTLQTVFFLGLLLTGLSMHYTDSGQAPMSFPTAVKWHNICGVTSGTLWLLFFVVNLVSGNFRYYIPARKPFFRDLWRQIHYYGIGMFRGDDKPFPLHEGRRFNPVQQLSYALAMYVLLPLAIISGVLLLFPLLAPERALGHPGLWPMAMLHLAVGYLLAIFLVFHIYMATTARTL